MLIPFLQVVAGLILLYMGGESLVKSAVGIASRLGMSTLAMGLTVVAFGTSTPELAVSISAALSGADDISIGNVIGSNIANLGLILSICSLIRPMQVQSKIIRIDGPLMLIVVSLICLVLANSRVSRPEGLLLTGGLLLYITFTFWETRRATGDSQAAAAENPPEPASSVFMQIFLLLLGFILLIGGGRLLVMAAVEIALQLDISQAVIGLTIVATGTSLPELVTSLVAALRGHGDMAIGNILGSNIFNVLGILGITAVISPVQAIDVDQSDSVVMVILSLATTLFLFTKHRMDRYEGAILLACYLAYTAWLILI